MLFDLRGRGRHRTVQIVYTKVDRDGTMEGADDKGRNRDPRAS